MRALHPGLVPWLEKFNADVARLLAAGFTPSPINAREGLANMTRAFVTKVPAVAWIQDDVVYAPEYNVPVRIFHPEPESELPVLVYFHGGGHMSGSVSVYDPICRKLALATRHIVVAPEYRLAPECPYPAGVEDACAVVKNVWRTLARRGVRHRKELALGGDSAGGALTATVSGRMQYDADVCIKKQVLVYPSLDYTMQTPSIDQNGEGYILSKAKIAWYFDNYFSRCENRKAASPLFWDVTPRLPQTLVMTAEFCPLRDEGQQYAHNLSAAGIAVELVHFEDMPHVFVNLENLVPDACDRFYKAIGAFLAR